MIHIQAYENFLFENMDDNGSIPNKVYHNSPSIINELGESPMWFSLDLETGKEYYNNMIFDGGVSYLYEGTVNEKIPNLYSNNIIELFRSRDIDINDWIADIVGNPSEDEVMSLEGTSVLIENGYAGIIHPDYDPADPQMDIEVLLIFNPKKSVTGFKLIKKSG
jgi:hypothetical protein